MKAKRTNLLDEDLSKWTAALDASNSSATQAGEAESTDCFFEKINRLSIELDQRLLKLEAKIQD